MKSRLVLLFAVIALGFSACKDEEKNDNPAPNRGFSAYINEFQNFVATSNSRFVIRGNTYFGRSGRIVRDTLYLDGVDTVIQTGIRMRIALTPARVGAYSLEGATARGRVQYYDLGTGNVRWGTLVGTSRGGNIKITRFSNPVVTEAGVLVGDVEGTFTGNAVGSTGESFSISRGAFNMQYTAE